MISTSSFLRRRESRKLNNTREAEQLFGFLRSVELLTNWIPACTGMTGVVK